ncbi:MAG TPA: aminotransferase class V-fold PLP-dependent enzyme, partial [Fimbriimonadaceae bacterium]|nr:aminotransferase class V-fold PLP-dependent enzyme [Fimbriimonadaceae bacterium]
MSPAGELGGSPACSAHELLDYTSLNVEKIRLDFPILDQEVNGKKLVYLDNAASTQKPLTVIDAIRDYYLHDHANVHRGVHALSQRATEVFEGARRKIQRFMNAPREHEIILTKGCTEAINLVAATWGRANLGPGDQVLITAMEHHADIVPWQMVCQQTGAQLLVAPITDDGELIMEEFLRLLTERVKLV